MTFGKIKDYLILARIDSQASVVLPLTSALVSLNLNHVSHPFGIIPYFLSLFGIALSFNTLGFALNDYADIEIDRLGGYLSDKPLVNGTISKKVALAFAMGAALSASLFAYLITNGDPIKLVIFALSIVLGLIYDFFGKKFVGSDIFLAGSISTFCLFNATSVSPEITLANIPRLIYVYCFLFFLQVLYNDTVHGGVKNVDHDHLGGAKTLALTLGVKLEGNNLMMPINFIMYGLAIKILYVALLLYAFMIFNLNTSYKGISIFMLMIPLLIGVFSATSKYLTIETWDRRKLFRIRNINEYCTYSLIPVMSISIIGLEGVLALMSIPVVFPIVSQLLISGRASLFLPKGYE